MKKTELKKNIEEIKRISSKMPKTINEALNFNEEDDFENEPMMDEPMEQPVQKPMAHNEDGMDVDNFISNMRKSSLKIMAKLSDDPDSSVYQFAKKIFQMADKAHEDEKEGKDINGQPKQQGQQQMHPQHPNNF